jgi:hypothetical protein
LIERHTNKALQAREITMNAMQNRNKTTGRFILSRCPCQQVKRLPPWMVMTFICFLFNQCHPLNVQCASIFEHKTEDDSTSSIPVVLGSPSSAPSASISVGATSNSENDEPKWGTTTFVVFSSVVIFGMILSWILSHQNRYCYPFKSASNWMFDETCSTPDNHNASNKMVTTTGSCCGASELSNIENGHGTAFDATEVDDNSSEFFCNTASVPSKIPCKASIPFFENDCSGHDDDAFDHDLQTWCTDVDDDDSLFQCDSSSSDDFDDLWNEEVEYDNDIVHNPLILYDDSDVLLSKGPIDIDTGEHVPVIQPQQQQSLRCSGGKRRFCNVDSAVTSRKKRNINQKILRTPVKQIRDDYIKEKQRRLNLLLPIPESSEHDTISLTSSKSYFSHSRCLLGDDKYDCIPSIMEIKLIQIV